MHTAAAHTAAALIATVTQLLVLLLRLLLLLLQLLATTISTFLFLKTASAPVFKVVLAHLRVA
jgi:hypothetical protein